MRDYIDFLFYDEESGEEFFVELAMDGKPLEELLKEAQAIANNYFEEPVFEEVMTPDDAAMMGLDTY